MIYCSNKDVIVMNPSIVSCWRILFEWKYLFCFEKFAIGQHFVDFIRYSPTIYFDNGGRKHWCRVVHDDVIKWKHFPRYWPFVQKIHRSPMNSPHKGQWRRALMFSLICIWINGWVNNREAGNLRRRRAHYDVTVMWNCSAIRKDACILCMLKRTSRKFCSNYSICYLTT